MTSKSSTKQTQPMSRGPTIEDLRIAIDRAAGEGVERADMLLRLTFRDASLIKRSPNVRIDEVSFADGEMRFLGVRAVVGPVPLSKLEAPAYPESEAAVIVAAPAKKAKAKAKPKAAKAVAAKVVAAG